MSGDPNVKCNPLLQSAFIFHYHWQNTALNNMSSLSTNERDQVSFQDFIKLQELLGNDSASLCCCILGNNNKKKRLLFQCDVNFKLIQCHLYCGLKELLGNCLSSCSREMYYWLSIYLFWGCLLRSPLLFSLLVWKLSWNLCLPVWMCMSRVNGSTNQVCNADSLATKGICFVLIPQKKDLDLCLQKPFSCLQRVGHFAALILRNCIPYLKLEFSWKSLKYKQYVSVLLM